MSNPVNGQRAAETMGGTRPIPLFVATSRRSTRKGLLCAATLVTLVLLLTVLDPSPTPPWTQLFRQGLLIGAAALLVAAARHQQQLQTRLLWLATWPNGAAQDDASAILALLTDVCQGLGARRAVLIHGRPEEAVLHVAAWDEHGLRECRLPGPSADSLLPGVLAGATFQCDRCDKAVGRVTFRSPVGLQRWRGVVVTEVLRPWLEGRRVLSAPFDSPSTHGRLFVVDGTIGRSAGDLLFAEGVVESLGARLHNSRQAHGLRNRAIVEERDRFSRDLHDGLLQSMTAWNLQLDDVACRICTADLLAAEKLREIRKQISADQRELRTSIGRLRAEAVEPVDFSLIGRLHDLRDRFADEWGLTVQVDFSGLHALVPAALRAEICRLVHEALANAGRHAQTSLARVAVAATDEKVSLTIQDRGCGFSFQGRFDLPTLQTQGRGPTSLIERVSALGGSLTLDSSSSGTTLEIALPIDNRARRRTEHAS